MDPTLGTKLTHPLPRHRVQPATRAAIIAAGHRRAFRKGFDAVPGLWRPALLLIVLAVSLTGCATHKPKPWETHKESWIERQIDPDDRAFYRDFFIRD